MCGHAALNHVTRAWLTSTRPVSHVCDFAADPGRGPVRRADCTAQDHHADTCSCRHEHARQGAFLTALDEAAIAAGLVDGETLNLDFHAKLARPHWG